VNVSGNAYMEAGSVYEYIISIEEPAEYLKITPSVPTSAIYFDPPYVEFTNYNGTVKKFKVKVSNGLTGQFLMSFIKQEGVQVFYNDIPSVQVSTRPSSKNFSIKFTNIDVKSVGLPIELEITLE
jgi:hypothetical protein